MHKPYESIHLSILLSVLFSRKGSVVTDFSVYFDYLDIDQGLFLVDKMDINKKLGDMPVGKFSTNSSKSK